MRRSAGKICVGLVCLGVGAAGCTPNPAPPPHTPPPPIAKPAATVQDRPASDPAERPIAASAAPVASADSEVVARVGTQAITKSQLLEPMLEAYGLNFLLHLVQVELARQAAAQQGITVSPDDFKRERELTLRRMFKESEDALQAKLKEATEKGDNDAAEKIKAELSLDKESVLDQYLAQSRQPVTRQEFDLALRTSTYLRKIAEASPRVKGAVTDELVKKAFGAQYGEKVVVRHIQASGGADLQAAKARIDAGENFAEVARQMSTNVNTAPVGGAIPPFTINATNVPQVFRDTAFSLKVGEVSDPVLADGAYHLIKVENRIEPKVVKFEDVKESLRADLNDKVLQAAVQELREKLQRQTRANLQIENPTLKEQFDKRLEDGKARQKAQIDEAMKRDRAANPPAPGAPAAQPDLPLPEGATVTPAPAEPAAGE